MPLTLFEECQSTLVYWLPYSSHTSHHPSQTPCLPWISYATLKQNFIAYHSSKVSWRPDCIFEIHQLWQSGFSRVYSNSCSSCSFEPEIMKICQSSYKMYINDILNYQESTTNLNVCTKKSGNLLNAPRKSVSVCQVFVGVSAISWFYITFKITFLYWWSLEYAESITCSGVRPSSKKCVLGMILNFIWWLNPSFEDLESGELLFIIITSRPSLTWWCSNSYTKM